MYGAVRKSCRTMFKYQLKFKAHVLQLQNVVILKAANDG